MSVKHLLSIDDLSMADIMQLIDNSYKFKQKSLVKFADNKIIATCFFEPSTRTRLSFESAALKLGAKYISIATKDSSSLTKGESINDSLRVISSYSDCIVVRLSSKLTKDNIKGISIPIINAGDGAIEHPSQTLVDLFSFHECFGELNGLKIALVGDLLYSRTIHSIIKSAKLFNFKFYFLAYPGVELDKEYIELLQNNKISFKFCEDIREVLPIVDIVYMTRLQQERGAIAAIINEEKYYLNASVLAKYANNNLKVFHSLPRRNEIAVDVDFTNYFYYFEQAANGVFVRQAILAMLLEL